ncbi:cytochrome d ubiquinol oxidase subunit II [Gryllotalpicola reticulitermitis]|uniref:Cytochrome d ubiquinol oxidase subunit II n=1 Tax=Gryllotalpicola reticulitermitis TaxID=1184153 RepID=A0ABV8Q3X6_9MICO
MTLLWFLLVLLSLSMYIVFDGYDLGIGVANLIEGDRHRARHMIELVATGWDGNETWLILLGVALWGGFPLAFAVILPHLYLPLIAALFGLIVRGFSIEMISQTENPAAIWRWMFGLGSLVAAFFQGFALGGLTAPTRIVDGTAMTTGGFPWYGAIMGATVVVAYTALGYAYLKHKSEGRMRSDAAVRGTVFAVIAVALGVASLLSIQGTAAPLNLSTPLHAGAFWAFLIFAAAGAIAAAVTFPRRGRTGSVSDWMPFGGLSVTAIAVLLAFTAAHYPVLVPPELTVTNAVGPDGSLTFLLIGIGANMPLVVFYHWFAHRTFGGKFTPPADSTGSGRPPRTVPLIGGQK